MSIPSYPTIAAVGENIDRINALFSPFRSRELNPEHYDQKLKFWIKSIDEFTSVDKRVTFTVKELESAFKVQSRVAACLPDVIEHLRRRGEVMTEDECRQSLKSPNTWLSWTTKPLKFAASTLWSFTPFSDNSQRCISKDTLLVHVSGLSTIATSIQLHPDIQNTLMTLEEWKAKVGTIVRPEEVDLLLEYFKTKGMITMDKLGETEIVKVIVPGPGQGREITAAEKGQFDITRTKEKLEKDLEAVLQKQQHADTQARVSLKEGQRMAAKHHLRSKKLYEKRSQKLEGLIDNLSVILFQIEDAQSDARVLSAYEAGKKALGKVLEDNHVTVDRVTDAMLDLQEALEDQSEISTVLGRNLADDDTKQLDEELEELLRSEEAKVVTPPPKEKDTSMGLNTSNERALLELEKLSLEGVEDFSEFAKEEKSPSQA